MFMTHPFILYLVLTSLFFFPPKTETESFSLSNTCKNRARKVWLHTELCLRALSKCYGCVSVCLSSRIHSPQFRKIELSREPLPHRCVSGTIKPATHVATHAAVSEEMWTFIFVVSIALYFFCQAKLYERLRTNITKWSSVCLPCL